MTMQSRDVRLPADLCAAAEQRFAHQFGNVEELIVFLLRYVTGEEAERLDRAELHMVEERLRDLGYI
jgi:hypothetical protein